jgi:hypothetical protein
VLEAIQNQINALHEALSSHLLITSIIGSDFEHMTEIQTIVMRELTIYLFGRIRINAVRLQWKSSQKWLKCKGGEKLVPEVQSQTKIRTSASVKHDLPPFLERNKEICISLKTYIHEQLAELSTEMVCEYLHNTGLPMLVKEEVGLE